MINKKIKIEQEYLGRTISKSYDCEYAYVEKDTFNVNSQMVRLIICKSKTNYREKKYIQVFGEPLIYGIKARFIKIYLDDELLAEFYGKYDGTMHLPN